MSFHFDPYTGEKIEDPEESVQSETPAADGEASQDEAAGEAGAEAAETASSEEAVTEASEAQDAPKGRVRGYDPMTGEPIYEDTASEGGDPSAMEAVRNAIPTDEEKPKSGGKAGFLKSPALIIVAAAVVALILVLFVGSRVILGRNGKYLKAIKNTIKPNRLETIILDTAETLAGGESTLEASGEVYDYSAEISLSQSMKAKKINLDAKIEGDDTATLSLMLDDQKIVLQAPEIIGDDLAYDFVSGDHGSLDDVAGKDMLDDIDKALQSVFVMDDTAKYRSRLQKLSKNYFNKLKFKKDDEETIKIDGKKRKCKGYTAEIDSDLVMDYYDEFYEVIKDYLDESSLSKSEKTELKSSLNEASKQLENMPDIDLTLYLFKGALAGLRVQEGRDELCMIEFHGGSTRMENFDVAVNGEDVLEVEGETDKGVESVTLYISGEEVMSYEYDFKDGDLELTAGAGKQSASVTGTLEPKSGGFALAIEDGSFAGTSIRDVAGKDFSLKFSITDKASAKNIKDDDAEYLNDLDMSDISGILEDAGKWAGKFFGVGDLADLW